jgi:hypothetical protein
VKTYLTAAAVALLLVGGAVQAQDKKPVAFSALEALSAAEAQKQAAAWLKEVGKLDAATDAKLKALWKDEQRSILDRMADSLALGDATAAKLMAEARDPQAPAPIVLPEVFKNEKTSTFYRANLALVYARSLTNRRVYEEALDTLKLFRARAGCRSGRLPLPPRGVRARPAAEAGSDPDDRSAPGGRRPDLAGPLQDGRDLDAGGHAHLEGQGPGRYRSQDGQHRAPTGDRSRRPGDTPSAARGSQSSRRDDQEARERQQEQEQAR